jgi:hypothetical protein
MYVYTINPSANSVTSAGTVWSSEKIESMINGRRAAERARRSHYETIRPDQSRLLYFKHTNSGIVLKHRKAGEHRAIPTADRQQSVSKKR